MKRFAKCMLQLFAEAGADGDSAEVSGGTQTAENETAEKGRMSDNGGEKSGNSDGDSSNEPSGGGETHGTGEGTSENAEATSADPTHGMLSGVRESVSQRLREAEINAVLESWRREEKETKEIYPAFSMQNELLHEPMFGALLKSGIGVRHAYECVHLREIIGSAIRYAVADIGRKTAVKTNSAPTRPGENSVLDRAASVTRTDVNSLTDRDIRRILSEVSKGAKISFK